MEACPLCLVTAARVRLFDSAMAEGELDVDSLISRLLEGEFSLILAFISVCWMFSQVLLDFRSTCEGIK